MAVLIINTLCPDPKGWVLVKCDAELDENLTFETKEQAENFITREYMKPKDRRHPCVDYWKVIEV